MSKRKVPEHLYPAFCLFVLAVKRKALNYHGEMAGGRVFAEVAKRVIVVGDDLDAEARLVALEEAGGFLR